MTSALDSEQVGIGAADELSLEQRLRNYALFYPDHPSIADVLNEAADTLEALLLAYKERGEAVESLRDCLLGIALSDRYRRYPKQYEDGGLRGQSGLRAVRALTGKHGSYLSDAEVERLDKEARSALTRKG